MAAPKRVLCIMDMAVVGRSSMAVVLPVLAACGVQGCPLPTILYSSHHGGFQDVYKVEVTDFAEDALSRYRAENIHFDAIYVGYLTSKEQFSFAWRAMRLLRSAFKIVDPVLGDNCQLYSQVNNDIVDMMKGLCGQADVITPNYTESALLLGEVPILKQLETPALKDRLKRLGNLSRLAGHNSTVLITGAPAGHGRYQLAGCHKAPENSFTIPLHYVPQSYPGTGDLFTSALTGLILQGNSLEIAALRASRFVEAAVRATYEGSGEIRNGVWFEGQLSMLLPGFASSTVPGTDIQPL